MSNSQTRATAKYDKDHMKAVMLKLNLIHDADIRILYAFGNLLRRTVFIYRKFSETAKVRHFEIRSYIVPFEHYDFQRKNPPFCFFP